MAGFCRQTRGLAIVGVLSCSDIYRFGHNKRVHAVILRVHGGRRACGETAEDGYPCYLSHDGMD